MRAGPAVAAAFAVLAAVTPARAEDRPQAAPVTTPTRDVDVLYRATAGGQVVEQRSRFAAAAQKVRIDTPSPGLHLIVDRAGRTMDMVSDGDRAVLEMAYNPAGTVDGFAAGQTFVRGALETVAGLPCTEWQTADTAGRSVTACFTADGLMLRARVGPTVMVEAARVSYGPIEPSVFAIPADYRRTPAPRSARQP